MYIEMDEGYHGHRKTLRLCALLKCDTADCYPPRLWTWASRSAPDGDLTGMDPAEIELALRYRGKAGTLFEALARSGFIDRDETTGAIAIHNWRLRTGGAIVKMESEAERKRLLRAHKAKKCDALSCPFHSREDARPPPVRGMSDGRPADGSDQDKTSQDQSSQDQARQEEDAPRAPAPVRSTPSAKIWSVHDWRDQFGRAWSAKYQRHYGDAGDTKAVVSLGYALDPMPESERLEAQKRAPEMFAEFLGSADAKVVQRRHPFVFFVQEWGGLRVAKQAAALGGARASPVGYAPVIGAKNYAAGAELFAKETA